MRGLIAVDDDARRITTALVRISQFDSTTPHHRRLMLHHRPLERFGELRRRDFGHRRVVGLDGGDDELTDTRSMPCRDEMHRRVGNEVEFEFQLPTDLIALLDRNAVPLVHGDDERTTPIQREPEHVRILLTDGVMRIDDEDDDMRRVDCLQRARDTRLLDEILDLAATTNARGVDQSELATITREWYEDAVNANRGENGNFAWATSRSRLEKLGIHASETAWVGTKFDVVLDNNSSLDHLYEQVTRLVQDPPDAR